MKMKEYSMIVDEIAKEVFEHPEWDFWQDCYFINQYFNNRDENINSEFKRQLILDVSIRVRHMIFEDSI